MTGEGAARRGEGAARWGEGAGPGAGEGWFITFGLCTGVAALVWVQTQVARKG
jgi:hypothetical protein